MILANCDAKTKLFDEAQYLGSKIWTVGMIAQVFRERLFATIRRLHAGLDCYLRNSEPLVETPTDLDAPRAKNTSAVRSLKCQMQQ